MREIKFKQPIFIKGKFDHWHYWGFIKKGHFAGPELGVSTYEEALGKSCQYTGLKDKNGKEIYEGDIVNARKYDKPKWDVYEVCWGYSEWLFRGYYNKPISDEFYSEKIPPFEEIEVIGNIYENPELLKGK